LPNNDEQAPSLVTCVYCDRQCPSGFDHPITGRTLCPSCLADLQMSLIAMIFPQWLEEATKRAEEASKQEEANRRPLLYIPNKGGLQ